MAKYINNPSNKSDKHQTHERKYATSHNQATLEKWFKKMTTPRNPIGRPKKVKVPKEQKEKVDKPKKKITKKHVFVLKALKKIK